MSSFKKQNIIKCLYCNSISNNKVNQCKVCKLFSVSSIINIRIININNIYVINLKKDNNRLVKFNNQLKKAKININNREWGRFDAIDGNDYKLVKDVAKKFTNKSLLSLWEKHKGSIGCYLSHLKLWKNLESNEGYSLIMEDDALFIPNGLNNLEIAFKQSLRYNWDILYVGHNMLSGKTISPLFVRPNINENNRGFNSGFFGYIIRHSSIHKLLKIFSRFDSPFIDVQARLSFKEFNPLFVKGNLIRHVRNISSRKMRDNY